MTNETGLTQNLANNKIWIGIGIGTAIGVAIALKQRKNGRWATAKHVTQRVADRTGDLAEAGKDIVEHVRVIYNESRKLADEAAELWTRGRKMVRA
jgi:hypothetical protein